MAINYDDYLVEISSRTNVRFKRLVTICTALLGEPRIHGDHYIFRTGWRNNPILSLQEAEGGKAKPYQVDQVIRCIERLKDERAT